MEGLFGGMFDFNRDGKLNSFERAAEMVFLDELMAEADAEDEYDEKETELELHGINPEDLEFMDEYERREVLEDAGLDPDDFDF